MLCPSCDSEMHKTTLDRHVYRESGLDSVTLKNIKGYSCRCGCQMPLLPDANKVGKFIVQKLLRKLSILTADELLFIRKFLHLKVEQISTLLKLDRRDYREIENERVVIDHDTDLKIRALAAGYVGDMSQPVRVVAELFQVEAVNRPSNLPIEIDMSQPPFSEPMAIA